ncbi:MAG TPA: FGGY-family carbohydrate kinase [Candidatus Binataceae bacterium]|nr:FGGY-family carbohydrate kinase [Candidatus Binataceae bacterium]
MHVLAIDMGSGSVKAAIISSRAEVKASSLRQIGMQFVGQSGAEQDPAEMWSAVKSAAQSAISEAHVPAEEVAAVVCTTQWAVTIPVDRSGDALGNAISWMDMRGGPYSSRLVNGWPRIAGYSVARLMKWIRLTGGAPMLSGNDSLGHILFLKNEQPDIYHAAHKFLEPMDYLNLKLTGNFAASFGTIYPYWLSDNRNPNSIDYAPELLTMTGIARDKLPDLMPVNAVLGTLKPDVARELGLRPETRVMMGSLDNQAAAIGAGCVRDCDGYFYIGTTSWMSCHVPAKKTDMIHMISTMPAALAGRYAVTAEQGAAGRCIEFLKDLLFPPGDATAVAPADVYAYIENLAADANPGSDGLIFTPWITGVLAPTSDSATRSAFFNQTARTTRSHYARAVMEGIGFNLRWLKGHVEKFIGRRFEHLAFIGGGARSEVWCQILADILDCPIRQIADPRNANAVGAAMAALAALGEIRLDEIESLVKVSRVFSTNPKNRAVYDRNFREFIAFYNRARPIYRRLNAVVSSTSR